MAGFGTFWRRTQRLEIALGPFICCVSQTVALVSSELFWTWGGLEGLERMSAFQKLNFYLVFPTKFFCLQECKCDSTWDPTDLFQIVNFRKRVPSWSKWLKFFISLECSSTSQYHVRTKEIFVLKMAWESFSVWEDMRGREWGVNSEENKGVWVKHRAHGFMVLFFYLPKHYVVGAREALPGTASLTQEQPLWLRGVKVPGLFLDRAHSARNISHISLLKMCFVFFLMNIF